MEKNTLLWLGITILLATGLVVALRALLRGEPPPPAVTAPASKAFDAATPPDATPDSTPDAPGRAVPIGIKGLAFGLTLKEASTALGVELVRGDPPAVSPSDAEPGSQADAIPAPGFAARFRTTLGAEAASCDADFGDDELLAGVRCEIEFGVVDRATEVPRYNTVLTSLVRQYGEPDERGAGSSIHELDLRRWTSEEASLVIYRSYRAIAIENLSAARVVAIRATAERARRERDERRARAQKLRDEAAGRLDRDLGGPAERPR